MKHGEHINMLCSKTSLIYVWGKVTQWKCVYFHMFVCEAVVIYCDNKNNAIHDEV